LNSILLKKMVDATGSDAIEALTFHFPCAFQRLYQNS
jgi:hypothetical protein